MSIKLYYFDGRGSTEPIRWILSYGGIEFEDVRIPITGIPATLPLEIKEKARWGQVPLVEFEGKSLTQSSAISRYFAKKCNLIPENGDDDYKAALCDEYVDTVKDLMLGMTPLFYEKDEEKQKQLVKEACETIKTKYLNKFESLLKANDGKHLVENSLTWPDISLTYALHQFHLVFGVDLTEDYPAVKAMSENVTSAPGIKEWIAKRPNTKF